MHSEAVCVMRGGTPLGLSKHGMVFKPRGQPPQDCPGILALERDCQALQETVSFSARGVPCPGGYEPPKGAPSVGCGGAPPAAGFRVDGLFFSASRS